MFFERDHVTHDQQVRCQENRERLRCYLRKNENASFGNSASQTLLRAYNERPESAEGPGVYLISMDRFR